MKNGKSDARSALHLKIGLDSIAASVGDHEPVVELDKPVDFGEYTRQRGVIETEPDVRIPFWLLKPKGEGKRPLGVFPHGHDRRGPETTAGVYADEAHERKSLAEDRDVAVQAVKHGFVAIAPAVRGLATDGVPDLHGRHGKRDCRSHVMHCLLAGRTATGERVWDMQRILDWAFTLPEVDSRHTLMMGNSGGGMVTMFTAACDERIDIAVPSCSFAPSVSEAGYIFHCDCNMVPGSDRFGRLARCLRFDRTSAPVGRQWPQRHLVFAGSSRERSGHRSDVCTRRRDAQSDLSIAGEPKAIASIKT